MGRWFRAAWRKNTIISGFLAIAITCIIGYLYVNQLDVPDALIGAWSLVLAMFLRLKAQNGN